jgi:hypothetical protein
MTTHVATVDFERRRALRALATGVGAAASALWADDLLLLAQAQAAHAHPAATTPPQAVAFTPKALSPHQFQTIGALSELIIPTTDTPGTKAAFVDRFIDSVLETADTTTRERFLEGLTWLDARSQALFQGDFLSTPPARQTELLTKLSAGVDAPAPSEERAGIEFFTAIKSMTITGYYSTEIGLRQELGDDGRLMLGTFEGCTHPEHQIPPA